MASMYKRHNLNITSVYMEENLLPPNRNQVFRKEVITRQLCYYTISLYHFLLNDWYKGIKYGVGRLVSFHGYSFIDQTSSVTVGFQQG